mmetsp:Transcript_26396/g.48247  ORF Transcript_26396/g.48247 Transcript_26396/m.48247 type:complete len:313 (-) Transcript_26396:92-1030(-)
MVSATPKRVAAADERSCLQLESSSTGSHSRCWTETQHVVEASSGTALLQLLKLLHEDLRAYLFLFVELSCVGTCAAACRCIHTCIWADSAFWRVYGGPQVPGVLPGSDARMMREKFRRWLFHLDGMWTNDFRRYIEEQKKSFFKADYRQLLADAAYIMTGLMPGDDVREIEELSDIVCSLFEDYCPEMLDERNQAEVLVKKVEQRGDIFTSEQVRVMQAAFEQSMERHILSRAGPEDTEWARLGALSLHELSEDEEHPFGEDGWLAPGAFHVPDLPSPGNAGESIWMTSRIDSGQPTDEWSRMGAAAPLMYT